jgi:hypothetical protein
MGWIPDPGEGIQENIRSQSLRLESGEKHTITSSHPVGMARKNTPYPALAPLYPALKGGACRETNRSKRYIQQFGVDRPSWLQIAFEKHQVFYGE